MEAPPPFEQLLDSSESLTLLLTPDNPYEYDRRASSISGSLTNATIPAVRPVGNPPEYETARRPTHPVLYSFSPVSHNAMLLVPPSNLPDTRPLYHISVSLNCFNPLSAITCIRRGGTEFGEFVGEFELGISSARGTVYFHNKEFLITSVLHKLGSREGCMWTWLKNSPKHTVLWDTRSVPAVCTVGFQDHFPIAKFYRPTGTRQPSMPAPVSTLEVMPEGHERLDDILISLLISERKRLTPSSADHRALFS